MFYDISLLQYYNYVAPKLAKNIESYFLAIGFFLYF